MAKLMWVTWVVVGCLSLFGILMVVGADRNGWPGEWIPVHTGVLSGVYDEEIPWAPAEGIYKYHIWVAFADNQTFFLPWRSNSLHRKIHAANKPLGRNVTYYQKWVMGSIVNVKFTEVD